VSFGQRLKEFRKVKKITQEELATLLKIATPNISDYENGKTTPSIQSLQIIGNTYNLNLDWLLKGQGSMFIGENKDKKKFFARYDEDAMNADIQRNNEKLMQKILKLEKEVAELEAKEKEANKELLAAYRRIAQFFERKPTESPA